MRLFTDLLLIIHGLNMTLSAALHDVGRTMYAKLRKVHGVFVCMKYLVNKRGSKA